MSDARAGRRRGGEAPSAAAAAAAEGGKMGRGARPRRAAAKVQVHSDGEDEHSREASAGAASESSTAGSAGKGRSGRGGGQRRRAAASAAAVSSLAHRQQAYKCRTILDAAVYTLQRHAPEDMSYKQMAEYIRTEGLFQLGGETPFQTLNRSLNQSLNRGDDGRFKKRLGGKGGWYLLTKLGRSTKIHLNYPDERGPLPDPIPCQPGDENSDDEARPRPAKRPAAGASRAKVAKNTAGQTAGKGRRKHARKGIPDVVVAGSDEEDSGARRRARMQAGKGRVRNVIRAPSDGSSYESYETDESGDESGPNIPTLTGGSVPMDTTWGDSYAPSSGRRQHGQLEDLQRQQLLLQRREGGAIDSSFRTSSSSAAADDADLVRGDMAEIVVPTKFTFGPGPTFAPPFSPLASSFAQTKTTPQSSTFAPHNLAAARSRFAAAAATARSSVANVVDVVVPNPDGDGLVVTPSRRAARRHLAGNDGTPRSSTRSSLGSTLASPPTNVSDLMAATPPSSKVPRVGDASSVADSRREEEEKMKRLSFLASIGPPENHLKAPLEADDVEQPTGQQAIEFMEGEQEVLVPNPTSDLEKVTYFFPPSEGEEGHQSALRFGSWSSLGRRIIRTADDKYEVQFKGDMEDRHMVLLDKTEIAQPPVVAGDDKTELTGGEEPVGAAGGKDGEPSDAAEAKSPSAAAAAIAAEQLSPTARMSVVDQSLLHCAILCIADGHNGSAAADFFTREISQRIRDLVANNIPPTERPGSVPPALGRPPSSAARAAGSGAASAGDAKITTPSRRPPSVPPTSTGGASTGAPTPMGGDAPLDDGATAPMTPATASGSSVIRSTPHGFMRGNTPRLRVRMVDELSPTSRTEKRRISFSPSATSAFDSTPLSQPPDSAPRGSTLRGKSTGRAGARAGVALTVDTSPAGLAAGSSASTLNNDAPAAAAASATGNGDGASGPAPAMLSPSPRRRNIHFSHGLTSPEPSTPTRGPLAGGVSAAGMRRRSLFNSTPPVGAPAGEDGPSAPVHKWDFENEEHRKFFRSSVERIFADLDNEYLSRRRQEFRLYQESMLPIQPKDDGCSLIVCCIFEDWFVTCHVGDCRSILAVNNMAVGSQPAGVGPADWSPLFQTQDHTPGHWTHAEKILKNGGVFVDKETRREMSEADVIRAFQTANPRRPKKGASRASAPSPSATPQPPQSSSEPDPLSGALVQEPQSLRYALIQPKEMINELSIPPRRLNVGAALGALLFKLNPERPILSSTPDVNFVPINPSNTYALVMATDGLWDYMDMHTRNIQEEVGAALSTHSSQPCTVARLLGKSRRTRELYFDDFCCIVAYFGNASIVEPNEMRETLATNMTSQGSPAASAGKSKGKGKDKAAEESGSSSARARRGRAAAPEKEAETKTRKRTRGSS